MMQVWKYKLLENVEGDKERDIGYTEIEMPAHAKPLTVQVQNGIACMWALVDAADKKRKRKFLIAGTGKIIPHKESELLYVGTFMLVSGGLVFHVFEVLEDMTS